MTATLPPDGRPSATVHPLHLDPLPCEQSLLGCVMLDPAAWRYAKRITSKYWQHPAHRAIWHAMSVQMGNHAPVDIVTLSDYLTQSEQIGIVGGIEYLVKLFRETPSAVNADCYAKLTAHVWLDRAIKGADKPDTVRAILREYDSLIATIDGDDKQPPLRDMSTLLNPSQIDWLIDGWLCRDSLACLFGDSEAGKSFLALDWSLSVACGLDWQDHPTATGVVVYIAGEGEAGLARRVVAWQQTHDAAIPASRFYLKSCAVLDDAGTENLLTEIASLADSPSLIVADTVARTMSGDENSSEDMTAYVRALDRLRTATGACLLTIHHSGHADKTRGRGSSVLRAALDAEFSATRDKDANLGTLRATKSKDSTPPNPLGYSLAVTELPDGWVERNGDTGKSCVVRYLDTVPALSRKRSAKESIALRALHDALHDAGVAVEGSGGRPAVSNDAWRERAYQYGLKHPDTSPDTASKAFRRAREALLDSQAVSCTGTGFYFIP